MSSNVQIGDVISGTMAAPPNAGKMTRRSRGVYSTIFTEPEENNCFSIITQVIIRSTAFSFIFFVSSSKTSRNRAVAILNISASVL